MEKEVRGAERQGERRDRPDQAAEEGIGSRHRGARHLKKTAAFFAGDAK